MRRTGQSVALAAPPEGAGPPPADRLVILALAVLDEALDQAKRGRIEPSPALRLALGYLYRVTRRRGERYGPAHCETFWKWGVGESFPTAAAAGRYGEYRKMNLDGAFEGIAAAAGAPITPDVTAAIREARDGGNKKGPA